MWSAYRMFSASRSSRADWPETVERLHESNSGQVLGHRKTSPHLQPLIRERPVPVSARVAEVDHDLALHQVAEVFTDLRDRAGGSKTRDSHASLLHGRLP